MKFLLIAFTVCIIATSCGNNEAAENNNTMDSIGNPSDSPSSTSVLTDDSTQIKDTSRANTLRH